MSSSGNRNILVRSLLIFFILFQEILSTGQDLPDHARFIDPFICTGNDHGQTDPAAGVPFGMAKPCPDTDPTAHSGYDFSASEIIGFSQTRFSGVGCSGTGGNIRILPFISSATNGNLKYIKESELAQPGFYSVELENHIKAELAATRQVSFQRFTFPGSDQAGFSIDLGSSFAGHINEEHHWNEQGILTGKIQSETTCNKGSYSFYFALFISKPTKDITENGTKITYRFSTSENETITVYCALSVVSETNALQSLLREKNNFFEQVKQQAYGEWNKMMGTIQVRTDDNTLKKIFYTHLYHTLQTPFIINDLNGEYKGCDGKTYQSNEPHFHGWSVWDTFRTKLPLISLLYPEIYTQMMGSLKELYKQGKPDWATGTEPFLTVRTEHSVIELLEAQRKGLLPFSLDDIYPYLKKEAESLPFKSPDNVLESSYDLWALSEIAGDLGYSEDQAFYSAKAFNYKKVWQKKFMKITRRSDVMHASGLYEGTLWQYRWFVPFDINGIQKMLGGKTVFEEQLDYFFDHELFNIGNQPDIQVPYLYAYTNAPWKTQQLVTKLLTQATNNWYGTHKKWQLSETRKIFNHTPAGYISEMDDDAGTMAAWYVWSAIGLYPVFPGSTQLVITTPLFSETKIKLNDQSLTIKANGLSDQNKFIQEIHFNGEKVDSFVIDFNQLSKGGILELKMGENPPAN